MRPDIDAAHAELVRRGIEASEMWHGPPFPPEGRLSGPDPKRTSYGSFFSFADPDGNTWPVRRSPRGSPAESDTAFSSTAHLASALRRRPFFDDSPAAELRQSNRTQQQFRHFGLDGGLERQSTPTRECELS